VPVPEASEVSAGSVAVPSVLVKWTVPEYPVTTALEASSAVTVTATADPAVAVAGAVTEKCVAGAALTVMVLEVPVIDGVTVSVAVMVWGPSELRVEENVPAPFVSPALAGSVAEPSLLVKWTVPAYPVAWLLKASSAVTVKENPEPVVAVAGAETVKWVADPEPTVIDPEVPVTDGVTVSVAVMVCRPAVVSVAEKVPVPDTRVVSAGSVGPGSELVKCTIPEYPVVGLSAASRAVTVKENDEPAVAVAGVETRKCVAGGALTVMVPEVPV